MESSKSRRIALVAVVMLLLALSSCTREGHAINKTSIRIFKGTEVWDLAVAVNRQNVKKIDKIAEQSPELLDFQDPFYRATLLMWAVGMEKYQSAEALLKNGADPNIIADGTDIYRAMLEEALAKDDLGFFSWPPPEPFMGETALFIASRFSWIDNQAKRDPKYVKLLLEYGADPNIYLTSGPHYVTFSNGTRYTYGTEAGTSPLIESIGCGIEKTKALVEAGADIDHQTESGRTVALKALRGVNVTIEQRKYAHYLIVEKKANVTEPYFRDLHATLHGLDPDEKFYPVDALRDWICDLDSEEYQLKMEIVEEFARQGVDYWDTEIPKDRLEQIQKLYPDTWEDYIKKY